MKQAIHREIEVLHKFFVDWFLGQLPDDAFDRIPRVMGEGFVLISPSGVRTERGPLLNELKAAKGGRTGTGFRIWIEGYTAQDLGHGLWLAEYEEHQQVGDKTTARLSTAVFREEPEAPEGVVWLRVHETWLPQP